MPKLLIIGYVWPEPDSSAAGKRMMQLIDLFLEDEYEVTFATTAVRTPYIADLEVLGVKIKLIELNNVSFNNFINPLKPDVVLFDRFMMEEQFGWRVAEACPDAIKILDTEDLHFLRKARQEAMKSGEDLSPSLLQSDTAKREIASIYRCDLSLIISEAEMDLLLKDFKLPASLLFYLPILQDHLSGEWLKKLPYFKERKHFVSIGNFRHEPNWDAVLHLKENIWPLIRKQLPEVEMHIYGAYPTGKVQQLNNGPSGFFIKGRARSALEVIGKARVLLAPLRFGAGIKGKFIDAMLSGTPTVTTETGAEGMAGDLPWNGCIENDPESFSRAAISLYSKEKDWIKAQENGCRILKERYPKQAFKDAFMDRLSALYKELGLHRENNFTGAMLSHHSLQSTRYLSKYIEMKNRLETIRNEKQ